MHMRDRFLGRVGANSLETQEVIPDPISLVESIRAIRYSVELAVVDLVDNSISAQADLAEVD
jgi:hypothetical protein